MKRIVPFIVGCFCGGMVAGGIESRLWSGSWGGDGFCVTLGVLVGIVSLAAISDFLDEDRQ